MSHALYVGVEAWCESRQQIIIMIHRFCDHKFQPQEYKLPALPHHGQTTLVSTKLCNQMYKPAEVEHDFDATTPREYTKPPLMEYSSLHDPHLRSYFYRPQMAIKLYQNGFIDKNLKIMVPLKVYNTNRKFMENELFKIHREKLEEEEHTYDCKRTKQCTQRSSLYNEYNLPERIEKRKQFYSKQEEKVKARQIELQEQLKREIMAQERIEEDKELERQRREAKKEKEREEIAIIKQQKRIEEREKAQEILNQKQAEHEIRLKELHKNRQQQMKEKINIAENRLQRYEKHTNLALKEEEEKKNKEQQIKKEKIQQRLSLFMTLQKREEEKTQKLSQYNRRQSQQLKREADKFEQHWKEVHDNKIQECREKIQRQRQFWARRQSQLPHVAHSRRSRQHSTIVNFYQEHSPLETKIGLPKISDRRRSSAFSHIDSMAIINGKRLNSEFYDQKRVREEEREEEEREAESGNDNRKVRFGNAECIPDNTPNSTSVEDQQ